MLKTNIGILALYYRVEKENLVKSHYDSIYFSATWLNFPFPPFIVNWFSSHFPPIFNRTWLGAEYLHIVIFICWDIRDMRDMMLYDYHQGNQLCLYDNILKVWQSFVMFEFSGILSLVCHKCVRNTY